MHFHFSKTKRSFFMNEKDPTLSGCDLTIVSSASTYSPTKSRHTANTISTASRRSVDAPGLIHGDMHCYTGQQCSGSYNGPENSSRRGERKARLLSPSRLLTCHEPIPQWPPSASIGTCSRNGGSRGGRSDRSRHDKENNARAAPNQHTTRHNNMRPNKRQPRLYTDENESLDSEPPPDFHPRKEIVHAIKCHEEMGKALSKLALNTQISDPNLTGVNSFTSTTLTGTSTFESFSTNSFRQSQSMRKLGARNKVVKAERDNAKQSNHHLLRSESNASSCEHVGDMFIVDNGTQIEEADSFSFSNGIEWSASGFSEKSNNSTKSDATSFSQHVAFLRGLEDHVKKFNEYRKTSDEEPATEEEIHEFFPSLDDLRSPPSCIALSKYPESSASEPLQKPIPLKIPQTDYVSDAISLSPPCTPASMFAFPCYTEHYGSSVDGEAILHGIAQIKEETASMLDGMESKLKSNLKELIEKEVVQIRSIVSEKSHKAEIPASEKLNSPCVRSPFSPSNTLTRNARTPQPEQTAASLPIDRNVLSEVIQKSLRSMETSILDKLTLHMDQDAFQQRAYLEEMIDEKVTKVMAGQNLELQMAIGEMKRATSQAAKQVAAVRPILQKSQSNANTVITPARNLTPIKFESNCTPESEGEMPLRSLKKEPSIRLLEDSFAETAKVLDDFVADCDELVGDFDKIAFRMEDSGADYSP